MKHRVFFGLMLVVVGVVSCRQADVRTAAIHVPGMKNEACANLIIKALATQQGVYPTQVVVRLEAQTIEVRFDSLTKSLKNLEYCVADAGFDANDIPGKPEAKNALPPDCR